MKLVRCISFTSLMVVISVGLCCAGSLQNSNTSSARSNMITMDALDVAHVSLYINILQDIQHASVQNISQWFEECARVLDQDVVRILQKRIATGKISTSVHQDLEKAATLIQKAATCDRIHGLAQDRNAVRRLIEAHVQRWHDGSKALNLYDLASWFWQQAHKIFQYAIDVKQSLKALFLDFPFKEFSEKVTSPTLKSFLAVAASSGSVDDFFVVWDTIQKFLHGDQHSLFSLFSLDFSQQAESQVVVLTLIKEFIGICVALIQYLGLHCMHVILQKEKPSTEQLLHTYNHILSLAIINQVAMLCDMGKQLFDCFTIIKQNHEPFAFGAWLKKHWSSFPIAIGVVSIKIIQYFQGQKEYVVE